MVGVEEAVPEGEVDHDQGTVRFPLGEVGLDGIQRFGHRHQDKLFHLYFEVYYRVPR